MQEMLNIKCSWSQCSAPATKHARFGNRTFGVKEILPAPDQNYTVLHRNLCEEHVVNIQAQYMDVNIFAVGECPTCTRI